MKNNKIFVAIAITFLLTVSGIAHSKDLTEIIDKGLIEFAAYEKFPPFSDLSKDGKPVGIDIDIGNALAKKLGVKAKFRLVAAGESVDDDLRNYIWKGHFTAGAVSDVMLHTPFDPNFSKQIEQVNFLPPYFQEQLVFAHDPKRIKNVITLEAFIDKPIGVEIETISDNYLLGAFGGKLRENVVHYTSVAEATQALANKEIIAVMGNRCEVESGLGSVKNEYKVGTLPTPGLQKTAWDIGIAVAANNQKLADALTEAMKTLLLQGTIHKIFKSHGITLILPSSIHTLEADKETSSNVTESNKT